MVGSGSGQCRGLQDDDDALEQLADGLKGRGDDAALAGVYRKRLEADIALKDESLLMDAIGT